MIVARGIAEETGLLDRLPYWVEEVIRWIVFVPYFLDPRLGAAALGGLHLLLIWHLGVPTWWFVRTAILGVAFVAYVPWAHATDNLPVLLLRLSVPQDAARRPDFGSLPRKLARTAIEREVLASAEVPETALVSQKEERPALAGRPRGTGRRDMWIVGRAVGQSGPHGQAEPR